MNESRSSHVLTIVRGVQRQVLLPAMLLASSSVLLLSGCGSSFSVGPSVESSLEASGLKGAVHGGQQPVSGSTIQIYAASGVGAGYGAAATALGTAVTTNGQGAWSYGSYVCTHPSDELYVVASGGNPGLSGTVNNAALVMMAALGPCSNIGNVGFVNIDEVTTVATAFSLAGFTTSTGSGDYLHVGTSSTNTVGLTNAFATFTNLADLAAGTALTKTPAYATAPSANAPPDTFRSIVPYDAINTLADILAACVNTDGGSNAGSGGGLAGGCAALFAITGGSNSSPAATIADTADAMIYIAHNPALLGVQLGTTNVSGLYGLAQPQAPFQPSLAAAPNDFTLTLNFIGGGLGGVKTTSYAEAFNLAIDTAGDIWVPITKQGGVAELNNLGAPLSPTTTVNLTSPFAPIAKGGWRGGGSSDSGYITIDLSGDVWMTDGINCLVEFSSVGGALSPSSGYTGPCGGNSPNGIAADASNNIWISGTNFMALTTGGSIPASFEGQGAPGTPYTNVTSLSGFVGADYAGHMFATDAGNNTILAVNATGSDFAQTPSILAGPSNYEAFGLPPSGSGLDIWIPQPGGENDLQPAIASGTAVQIDTQNLHPPYSPNSLQSPVGIAADGVGRIYVSMDGGGSVLPNVTVFTPAGATISNPTFGFTGASTLTNLVSPSQVSVDQSGNVWVVNTSRLPADAGDLATTGGNVSNVTEFVGLATPANPVFASDAEIGQTSGATAAGAYAVKP